MSSKRLKSGSSGVGSIGEEFSTDIYSSKVSKSKGDTFIRLVFDVHQRLADSELEVARLEERSEVRIPPIVGAGLFADQDCFFWWVGGGVGGGWCLLVPPRLFRLLRAQGIASPSGKTLCLHPIHQGNSSKSIRECIETDDWVTVENIRKSRPHKDKGLLVSEAKLMNPKVIMYDVNSNLKDEDFVAAVFEQNFSTYEKTLDKFCQDFKVAFRKGKRGDPSVKLVCQVDPSLRNVLLRKERLFVSLYSCRVVDVVFVS